jgi:phenylacetate-CoA ligase
MDEQKFPSRAEIEANQLEQLRALVTELFPGNKFYTQKLTAAGITFDIASLADFCSRFPFTTKSELITDQDLYPPFGTNLTYPLDRYTRFHQTSGTSGKPLRWLDTPESWDGMLESWMEIFRAADVTARDRVYFAFSFGPFIGFWLAFESAARLGCLCLPGGGISSAGRLRAILENQATVLCCTPTYALRLAEAAAEEKIDLTKAKVRALIVAGEAGGSIDSVRQRITRAWAGARVFDHHGMTETGPVTYECSKQPGVLHVLESAYLAEVIEPSSGKPVAVGQAGELVLTTLNRTGMPVLRYRTGDLVKLRALPSGGNPSQISKCVCGRHEMPFEGGIVGRTDDMLVIKGVNIFPAAIEQIVRAHQEIAEYQVEVFRNRALPELRLKIETSPDHAAENETARRLEKNLEAGLGMRVPVTAVPRGTLPKFELKAKRWITKD